MEIPRTSWMFGLIISLLVFYVMFGIYSFIWIMYNFDVFVAMIFFSVWVGIVAFIGSWLESH